MREFLSAVTACTNGDPVLLVESLDPDERTLSAREILSRALRHGRVDRSIKEHDRLYLRMNYGEYSDEGYLPVPGTFAVEKPEIVLDPIEASDLRALWLWLVTVRGYYAHNPPHSHDPQRLVDSFQSVLFGSGTVGGRPLGDLETWRHWIVRPDFLYAIDDTESGEHEPAYFEALGTNLVWMGVGSEHFLLFLLNAYPRLPSTSQGVL